MKVSVIAEHGYLEALFGLGLSHGKTSGITFEDFKADFELVNAMYLVSLRLAGKGGGHDKFLRSISVWLDITAPAYWWPEMDQYKVATTTQSESKMHTLMKEPITQERFENKISDGLLETLEIYRKTGVFPHLLNTLPHGWLQRRILTCNYASLGNMIKQRKGHKLPQWATFIDAVRSGVEHPELLP